jgi:HAD superfamily hydrolase (TIGR01490 family)
MQGWSLAEGAAAFEWLIQDYLLPKARPDIIERYKGHQSAGHATILVSGMPAPCLEQLGRTIGATGVVGTGLETGDGRYTGRVVRPVMIGREKSAQTLELVRRLGLDIDWAESFAYGDSQHDRWFMEMAGHPVAVYPDRALGELARQGHWQILGTPQA